MPAKSGRKNLEVVPGQEFVTATWLDGLSRGIVDLTAAILTQRQQVQTEVKAKRAAPIWSATPLSGHNVEIRHRMDLKPLNRLMENVPKSAKLFHLISWMLKCRRS